MRWSATQAPTLMRRPSVVILPAHFRQTLRSAPNDDSGSQQVHVVDVMTKPQPSSSHPSVEATLATALASVLTTAKAAVSPSATGPRTEPAEIDVDNNWVETEAGGKGFEVEGQRDGEEEEEEHRRKGLVLVSSIGLVIAFNFFYIIFFVVSQFLGRGVFLCLPWSATSSNLDLDLVAVPVVTEIEYAGAASACSFAAFAMMSNVYHFALLALFHCTGRLYEVAALFLAYVDLGVCAVCLYYGIVAEFYLCLASVVALAFFIFGRRASRLFLLLVLFEGLLLYPCSVYMFPPVAPLSLGPLERLMASCTAVVCVGIISHVHESSRQATLTRLREANEKLRQSSEAKTLFLSAITHELRTPLTGIIGMANELLLDEEKEDGTIGGMPADQDEEGLDQPRRRQQTDEERTEAVRIIATCARHLLGLVNDVLDFEKIESRQLDLESIPFNVEREADMVVSMLAFPAASNRVRVERRTALAHRIRLGDPLRFRQLLFNLLSNAIKFTPPSGTVTLSLSDDHRDLRVEVHDTGIGISETSMKNLFKHFSQGGTGVSRQYGGSGLGLAICKHLVEAMHGRIGCSSPGTNKGSTFWFTLPLPVTCADAVDTAAPSPAGSLPSSAPSSRPSSRPSSPVGGAEEGGVCDMARACAQSRHHFRGLKVLLVEDNIVNQKVGRRLLERIGCDVHVAENGQECIDMLERECYSLIFMDCQMPILDGYEATRRIREKEKAEQRGRIPIVALTASCIKSDRQVCFDSGMDDWMAKPFDQGALCSALLKWATRQPQDQAER